MSINFSGFLERLLNHLVKQNQYFTGLLPDVRKQSEKDKDYLHEERLLVTVADPFGNAQLTQSPYPYTNQYGTSSCVPHAITLALSIEVNEKGGAFTLLSALFPYRLRSNFAQEGSAPQNIFEICRKFGAPLLSVLPEVQTEYEANALWLTPALYANAALHKGLTYFTFGTPNNINSIAQVAQQGRAVVITLFATYDEYSKQYPSIDVPTLNKYQAEVQHEVCVLPHSGFTLNGVKYVAIQDSSWFAGWKLRYLSEAFIKARVYGAGYWLTVPPVITPSIVYPAHTFTSALRYGDEDEEVRWMQLLLIAEGLLPADCATGLFAGRTLAAVKAFQAKYASEILLPSGLLAPTGFFGEMSIKKANTLCKV